MARHFCIFHSYSIRCDKTNSVLTPRLSAPTWFELTIPAHFSISAHCPHFLIHLWGLSCPSLGAFLWSTLLKHALHGGWWLTYHSYSINTVEAPLVRAPSADFWQDHHWWGKECCVYYFPAQSAPVISHPGPNLGQVALVIKTCCVFD